MATFGDRLKELGKDKGRGWQAALARACGVKPPSVAEWLNNTTKNVEGKNVLAAAEFFGVNPTWLLTGKGERSRAQQALPLGTAEPLATYGDNMTEQAEERTVDDVVTMLADMLAMLEPADRARVELALNPLFKDDPQRALPFAKDMVATVMKHRAGTPSPTTPSTPSHKRKKATPKAEKKAQSGRANLILKIGGGQKQQFDLPLQSLRKANDERNAPANERAWYDRVKAVPKAVGVIKPRKSQAK
jgi:transcriptional regulator with XRE-family HTH domain